MSDRPFENYENVIKVPFLENVTQHGEIFWCNDN
jgi:hypothetical protein